MVEGSMSECPKCGRSKIKVEIARFETEHGMHFMIFDVFTCEHCGYSELYFRDKH